MAKQSIGLGTTPNDGTGDNLRVGGDKVNDNFNEIYSALGNGTDLQITTGAFHQTKYCNGTLQIIDLNLLLAAAGRYFS